MPASIFSGRRAAEEVGVGWDVRGWGVVRECVDVVRMNGADVGPRNWLCIISESTSTTSPQHMSGIRRNTIAERRCE